MIGCNKEEKEMDKNKLVCSKYDEIGKGITEITFKDEIASNVKTSIEFYKEEDANDVCNLYNSFDLEDIKVICDKKIVSMESSKLAEEYQGKTIKNLKQQLEEDGYTCK